jgi:hypothetical protein
MQFVRRPPGASEETIAEVERRYGVHVPHELRTFWAESDGAILWFGFKELQFFTVTEVLDDIYSVREHMPGGLPLCMDGNGNICLARISGAEVFGYYVAEAGVLEWEEAAQISSDFAGFLHDDQPPERRLDA